MPLSNKYLEDFTYRNPTGKEPVMDGSYNTGEYIVSYTEEIPVRAFVSADANRSELAHFGATMPFEKTCMTNDKSCGVIVGSLVSYGGEYWIVKKIINAKCLSYFAWGMDRVDINVNTPLYNEVNTPLTAQLEAFTGF